MHHQGHHNLEVSLGGRQRVGVVPNNNRSKSHHRLSLDGASSGLTPQRSARKIHSGGNMLNLYSFNKKAPSGGGGIYIFNTQIFY